MKERNSERKVKINGRILRSRMTCSEDNAIKKIKKAESQNRN